MNKLLDNLFRVVDWFIDGLVWFKKHKLFFEPPFLILCAVLLVICGSYIVGYRLPFRQSQPELINVTKEVADEVFDSKTGGFSKKFIDKMQENDFELLLSREADVPEYKDWLFHLGMDCPYYTPDGNSYRECLFALLTEYEEAVESKYNDLVQDTRIVIDELKAQDDMWNAQNAFFTELSGLHKVWKPYRDSLCSTELAITWAGSNSEGMINICKLYQTYVYIGRLDNFRHDWVTSYVEQSVGDNIQPKTEAFKKLMEATKNVSASAASTSGFESSLPILYSSQTLE